MARPRKTGLDYFPHDVDVTTDPKIEPAILRYGAAAYAFYFIHLEYCYRAEDLSVDVSATEMGAEMREVIQRKLQISAEDYEGILRSFLRHGAFDDNFYLQTGRLTSNGIKKRAQKVFGKRERESNRYTETISDSISVPVSAAETVAETGEIKVNKTKVNKRKQNESIDTRATALDSGVSDNHKQTTQLNLHAERFDQFWKAYPRKVGKGAALKAWIKLKPSAELLTKMLKAIAEQKKSAQWQRDNGQYVPHPTTWLNQGRWDDEFSGGGVINGDNKQSRERDEDFYTKGFKRADS